MFYKINMFFIYIIKQSNSKAYLGKFKGIIFSKTFLNVIIKID